MTKWGREEARKETPDPCVPSEVPLPLPAALMLLMSES
jgi:hypothetical protein